MLRKLIHSRPFLVSQLTALSMMLAAFLSVMHTIIRTEI